MLGSAPSEPPLAAPKAVQALDVLPSKPAVQCTVCREPVFTADLWGHLTEHEAVGVF